MSNNSLIDEFCDNQWPDLLTCASDQDLDIKAIFDELGDSQQTPPNFYQKFEWTAPLVNGEIPENAFAKYGAKIFEFSADNLERVHTNAFIQTKDIQKILSFKFSPDKDTKLKNYLDLIGSEPSQYNLYKAFSQLDLLQELSINLDWGSDHVIPIIPFGRTSNKWTQIKNISFDGKFLQ